MADITYTVAQFVTETPTGRLRSFQYRKQKSAVLQQEWEIFKTNPNSISYEWRDVPLVKEEDF